MLINGDDDDNGEDNRDSTLERHVVRTVHPAEHYAAVKSEVVSVGIVELLGVTHAIITHTVM